MLIGTVNQMVAGTGFLVGGMATYLVVNALEPESEGLFQLHRHGLFYLLDVSCGMICAGISVGLASFCSDYKLERSLKQSDVLGIRSPLRHESADSIPPRMPMMRS